MSLDDTSQIQLRRIPYMYTANFVFSQLFLLIKDMYPGPFVIFLYRRRMEEQTNSVNLLSRCPDNYHLYHLALVLLTQVWSYYYIILLTIFVSISPRSGVDYSSMG